MVQSKKTKENKGKAKAKDVKVKDTKEVKAEATEETRSIFDRILDALKGLWAKIVALFTRIF